MSSKKIDSLVNDIYPEINEDNKKLPKAVPVEYNYETTYEVLGQTMTSYEKKQNKNVWTYVIVIIIFLLIIFVVWVVLYAYFIKDSETGDQNTDSIDINIGAYITPQQLFLITGKFNKKITEPIIIGSQLNNCSEGKYGDNCEFQIHDPKFYNIGSFDSNYVSQYIGEKNLSFNGIEIDKDSCTALCKENCTGVIYDHSNNECSLITSNVTGSGKASLNLSSDTQIYLKKTKTPIFNDSVVGYKGGKVLRYYFNNGEPFISNKIVRFDIGNVVNLSWCPLRIINYGNKIGYYSNTEFTTENYLEHDMLFIDKNKGEYSLPLKLQLSNIYILYI